jgi:hypothetical protein
MARLASLAAGGILAAALVSGCGAAGPTFSASGPCLVDGQMPGAFPQLEALVPRDISGRPATSINSGRNCTAEALGSLTSHGVTEIDYAGSSWDEGGGNAVSIAVLEEPAAKLPVAWAEEFYQDGAELSTKTANIETSRPTYPGAGTVFRLDTLNDLSFQSIVVWPDGNLIRVVLVATEVSPSASKSVHDDRVTEAVGAAVLAEQAAHASDAVPSGPGADASGNGPMPVLPSPS